MTEKLLNTNEVAAILQLIEQTPDHRADQGKGLQHHRIERCLRYRMCDVTATPNTRHKTPLRVSGREPGAWRSAPTADLNGPVR